MNVKASPRGALRLFVFLSMLLAAVFGGVGVATAQTSPTPGANPDFAPTCGAKVILVLDESNSIGTSGATQTVKNAANAFISGLQDTGSSLAIVEFSTTAQIRTGFTAVTAANITSVFNPIVQAYSPGGFTNWQDAMLKVQSLNTGAGGPAPLVVFVTDGDPTAFNGPNGAVTGGNGTGLNEAITAANAVKATPSHILTVGVGAALQNPTSQTRLTQISGTDVATSVATLNLSTTDVLLVSDFANLPAALTAIVRDLCVSEVNITKKVDLKDGSAPAPAAGWTFGATASNPVAKWIVPATATGDSATMTTAVPAGDPTAPPSVKFKWRPAGTGASNLVVTETAKANHAMTDVRCSKNGGTPVAVSFANSAFTVSNVGQTDTFDCTVINTFDAKPGLTVTKSTATPVITSGANVTWSVLVTNSGNVPLTNVTLSDPNATCSPTSLGNMAIGASTTVSCTTSNVTAGFTNTATATGHYGTTTVQGSGSATVKVAKIAIVKDTTTPIVAVGGAVTWTISVTNTGEVPLSNVTVADSLAGDCVRSGANNLGTLGVGATSSYTCTSTITGKTTNSATATGTPPSGPNVSSTDTATADTKGLSIQKTVNGNNETATVLSGAVVTWTLAVTNTGSVTLTDVTITDANAASCDGLTIASLAPGVTTNLTCQSTITADITNSATATGTDPNGGTTTSPPDTASVNMVGPGLTITKSVDKSVVLPGTTVTWTIKVTNTGDVPLTGVAVTDAVAPGCDKTIGAMPVGDVQTYTCTSVIDVDTTNVATVTGTEPQTGTPVVPPGPGEATVTVVHPGISITKSVDKPVVTPGTTVTWTLTVKNTGDVALSNVVVSDPQAPGCAATIASLAAGASQVITCTSTIQVDTTNVATVTATEPQTGTPVTPPGPGEATVKVIHPAISITKTVDKASVTAGTTVTYTITVKNTGDVALTNVKATDITLPACDRNIGDLAVGATVTYTCSGVINQTTVNTITVTGNDPNRDPVTPGSSSATVTVVPANTPPVVVAGTPKTTLKVDKSGPAKATVGKNVTYTIRITNTGASQAENVVVTDVIPAGLSVARKPAGATVLRGSIQWKVGTIQPGATVTLTIVMKAGGTKAVTRCNTAIAAGSNADQMSDKQCTRFAKVAGVKVPPKVTG